MDGANEQTGRKNKSSTFVLAAFISFGPCNIFAHGKYFLQSAHCLTFRLQTLFLFPLGVRSGIAKLGQD